VYGPYNIGPESGDVVFGAAVLVALSGLAAMAIRARRGVVDRRSWALVAVLAGVGSLAAAMWRLLTAGVPGLTPARFVLETTVPLVIGALLVLAVWLAVGGQGQPPGRTWSLTMAAASVALLLLLSPNLFRLATRDPGYITARQYAGVRFGEIRSVLHNRLGHEASPDFNVFPPVAAGLQCDYYYDPDAAGPVAPSAYQFCFRGGVLVTKASK
jgi:hypothetical protein